jgi:hypothetical protein
MPLQLWDKSDFIPELTINAQRLRAKSVQHPFFPLQSVGVFAHIQTLVHQSLKLKSSNVGPRPNSLGKSHPLKAHSVLLFSISILDFFILLPPLVLDRL